MKKSLSEFVLIFRMDISTAEAQPSLEQMEIYMEQWGDWIADISAKHEPVAGGNHLSKEGRVLKPKKVITEGPYIEKRKSVAGYIIIKATDFNEAVEIAKGCPILQGKGTSVEVRKVESM